MMFRVLGPLEVEVEVEVEADFDGRPARITVGGARQRALLTALLIEPNTVVPTHRLMDALWPRDPPDDPVNSLQQVVSRLRSQLGTAGAALVTRPPGYLLAVEPEAIDAVCFTAEYRTATRLRVADPAGAAALLERALGRWRGPAYGEFADGFALAAAAGLEELRIAAQEDRAELLLETGSPAAAVSAAQDLAATHPLRERPVAVLVRALHADGRTGDALAAYRRHRTLVADELGLDPSPELRALEARILRGEREAPVERPRAELPWRPGALLGRDRELDLLLGCLPAHRVVTLVGPGGVGKTRLVLEAAHRLATAGRSVWWVDLGSVTADRVVDAVAGATGAELARGADPVRAIARAVPGGTLCLDNAEHLLGPIAAVVERLVDAAPGLALLTTSRERLAVGTEHVHLLGPLSVPVEADLDNPAVRLFVERAPGLEADGLADADVAAIAEICRRLDGLPLAIELGAARAGAFGIPGLAARLGERLDLFSGGRRTAAARHRTLRAVVDWSYELLTPDEAELLARLAVFPGPFTLDRAEEVCAGDRVAPQLARLVEQSLVQAGQGRFWLLETLRAYAAERLDADEERALRERHARDTAGRLAALTAQLTSPDEPDAVAALTGLVADLHAAWTHAAQHDRDLAVRLAADVYDFAYHRQRLDLLAWGRAVAGWDVVHPRLADALSTGAAAAWAAGQLDEAAELVARAVRLDPGSARAALQQANLAMFGGRVDVATAGFDRAATLYRANGAPVRALMCEISVAHALNTGGRSAEALALAEELLGGAPASGNPTARCWALHVAGDAVAEIDPDRAATRYAGAIEQGQRADNRLFVALARAGTAALGSRHGDAERMLGEFDRLLALAEDGGNEAVRWATLLPLAELLVRVGAVRDATVLAGAVRGAARRRPALPRDDERLALTVQRARAALGEEAIDAALAEGAALPFPAAVARARRAIGDARA